jgi:hypothetical protein
MREADSAVHNISRVFSAVPTTLVSGYTDHNVRDVMFDTVIVKMSHVVTEASEPTR